MADHHGCHWPNSGKKFNAPAKWGGGGKVDHAAGAGKAPQKGILESLQKLRDFFKEGCILDFLGRSTPAHVDRQHVTQ